MLRFCGSSLVWITLCFLFVSGCGKRGGSATDVTGKVSYNGAPVTGGSIQLHPKKGGGAYPGTIEADGSFSFKGLPISGDVIVTVDTESLKNLSQAMKQAAGDADKQKMMDSMKGGKGGGVYVPIPPKYSDPKTSTLIQTVKEGSENHFDLVLKD